MEFVPVDAGPEGGLGDVVLIGFMRRGCVVAVVLLEDQGRVGCGAFHVAVPFAGPFHVLLGHAAVVEEHELDLGVDAALEPVAVARDGALRLQSGFEEAEERAVAEEAFEPEVRVPERQVGPPPSACACGGLGVVGIVLGEGAFGQQVLPALVPCVERLAPSGGRLGVVDAGEHVGELLERPAGLEPGFAAQVRSGVSLHVHQAALDPGLRPDLRTCFPDALHAVAHEHVGRCDPFEQRTVRGRALPVAPLPCKRLAVLPVDGYQQAPVADVGAVGHDDMVHDTVRADAWGEVPAPSDAPAEGARVALQTTLRRRLQQPVEEQAQRGRAASRPDADGRGRLARVALPALATVAVMAVLAHRQAADGAFAGSFRSCSHGTIQRPRTGAKRRYLRQNRK